jgi:Skp family chaperone for outer membrane proteins
MRIAEDDGTDFACHALYLYQMKNLFWILFLIPFCTSGQTKCKTAYFHQNRVLDSLAVPGRIQKSVDSLKVVLDKDVDAKKKAITTAWKSDAKTLKKKIKQAKSVAKDSLTKERRKWMQKFYAVKIRDCTLKIYDKGKGYESVFNADSKYYSNIPKNSCDITQELLRRIRETK